MGGRLNADWRTTTSSADSELYSSLTQMRARSRALCRDVSYAKRARMLVMNNVIGYRGFRALEFVAGSSDNVVGVDSDLGRFEWKT